MDNERTTVPPADQGEGQQSSAEAWREVGRQFGVLGESLAAAFRAAWESEETRRHVQEMQEGVETMVDEVSQAIKQTAASPEGQQVRQQVEEVTASAREAGERAFQEAQPHLLAALRDIDAELQKMISHMSPQEPSPGAPSDEEQD